MLRNKLLPVIINIIAAINAHSLAKYLKLIKKQIKQK